MKLKVCLQATGTQGQNHVSDVTDLLPFWSQDGILCTRGYRLVAHEHDQISPH